MKIINIKESLLGMDRETNCKYDLTTMYESLSLTEEKKKELVKYIDAYDIDATNKFLGNEFSSQGLMEYYEDDEFSDEELASIYGGDTKYDMPDGIETPEETEKRLTEDINESKLKTDIKKHLVRFMFDFGFDSSDLEDYSTVEVKRTSDGDMLHVEVRAELGYSDLTKLADKLDAVIQTYDKSAYFEPVTSGIIEAFVSVEDTVGVVEPVVVEHWVERFKNCDTLEQLRDEYLQYKDEREFMSQATIEEIDIVLDAKIDMLRADVKDESLYEGIFGKIGSKIKQKAQQNKDDYLMTKRRINDEKAQKAKEYSQQDKSKATSNIKDAMQGDIDINRAGNDKEELADMDRNVSGPKIASAPDYSKNKKGTNKTGAELDKAIEDARKKGEVYIADIGESLEEDFIDDDISFFDDDYLLDTENETFIEGGVEYEWVNKRITSHECRGYDGFNEEWFIASAKSLDNGETYFFVVDENDFIDWGPCDTQEEAVEFVMAKDGDYEDLDESKKRKGLLKDKVNKALKDSVNESKSIKEGVHKIYVNGELKDEIESSNPVHEVDPIAYKYKKLNGVKEVRVDYADGTTNTMQVESIEEETLKESSLLDKVNAALAREENNI